jgi:hypothetical protein
VCDITRPNVKFICFFLPPNLQSLICFITLLYSSVICDVFVSHLKLKFLWMQLLMMCVNFVNYWCKILFFRDLLWDESFVMNVLEPCGKLTFLNICFILYYSNIYICVLYSMGDVLLGLQPLFFSVSDQQTIMTVKKLGLSTI